MLKLSTASANAHQVFAPKIEKLCPRIAHRIYSKFPEEFVQDTAQLSCTLCKCTGQTVGNTKVTSLHQIANSGFPLLSWNFFSLTLTFLFTKMSIFLDWKRSSQNSRFSRPSGNPAIFFSISTLRRNLVAEMGDVLSRVVKRSVRQCCSQSRGDAFCWNYTPCSVGLVCGNHRRIVENLDNLGFYLIPNAPDRPKLPDTKTTRIKGKIILAFRYKISSKWRPLPRKHPRKFVTQGGYDFGNWILELLG